MAVDDGLRGGVRSHAEPAHGEGDHGTQSHSDLAASPATAATARQLRPMSASKGSPLSWFQERLWIHHLREPDNTSYNLPLQLLIQGELDVSALEQSLSEIVARHESLRTLYGQTDWGEPVQFVAQPERVRLPVIAVDRAELLAQLERHLEHRFDLQQGPIFIASLLCLSPDRH